MEKILHHINTDIKELDKLSNIVFDNLSNSPQSPQSGSVSIFAKEGVIYQKTSDGTETSLVGGSGGTSTFYKRTVSLNNICPASWTNTNQMLFDENRIWSCVWTTENYIYVIGGCKDDWTVVDTVLRARLDNLTSWEVIGHLPSPRARGTLLQDKYGDLFFIGGYDSDWNLVKTIFKTRNQYFGEWVQLSETSPVSVTNSFSYGDKRYLVGGYDDLYSYSHVWEAMSSDLTNWTVVSYLPEYLTGSSILIYDDVLYVIGGYNGTISIQNIYSANMSNISTWTTHSSCLYQGVCDSNLIVIGDTVYLYGGRDSNYTPISTVQYTTLNQLTSTWMLHTSMTDYDSGVVLFYIDPSKKIWRLGGEVYSPSLVPMLYTPLITDIITVTSEPNIGSIYQYPSLTIEQAYEVLKTEGFLVLGKYKGILFGDNSYIIHNEKDGSLCLKHDSEYESKILTNDDIKKIHFYHMMEDV